MSTDDSPQKRKRTLDDSGSQHSKKMHMEGQQRLDFEALHQDVGEKYLVGKMRKTLLSTHFRRGATTPLLLLYLTASCVSPFSLSRLTLPLHKYFPVHAMRE